MAMTIRPDCIMSAAVKPNLYIVVDQAKKITKERLRNERRPLLEAQDVLFMKDQEDGADTTASVTEKNRL